MIGWIKLEFITLQKLLGKISFRVGEFSNWCVPSHWPKPPSLWLVEIFYLKASIWKLLKSKTSPHGSRQNLSRPGFIFIIISKSFQKWKEKIEKTFWIKRSERSDWIFSDSKIEQNFHCIFNSCNKIVIKSNHFWIFLQKSIFKPSSWFWIDAESLHTSSILWASSSIIISPA